MPRTRSRRARAISAINKAYEALVQAEFEMHVEPELHRFIERVKMIKVQLIQLENHIHEKKDSAAQEKSGQ